MKDPPTWRTPPAKTFTAPPHPLHTPIHQPIPTPTQTMTFPNPPSTTLDILPRADGSARYTQNGYTVLGAVNAPIEVQRRDELPEEAAIEVNVRPAVGVGGRPPFPTTSGVTHD